MRIEVKYSGLEDRQVKATENENKGLSMLHDNFDDPSWKHGDPIIGTMTFTNEPSPVVSPPEPSPLEKDVAQLKLDIQAIKAKLETSNVLP